MRPAPRILARGRPAVSASCGATLALAVGLLAACSSGEDPAGPAGAELQASRTVWAGEGFDDYRYVLQRLCECLPADTREVLVEVHDGDVVSRTYLDDGQPVRGQLERFYPSVEGLFELAEEALEEGADTVDIDFHGRQGYPVRLYVDYEAETADEELLLLASGLEAL